MYDPIVKVTVSFKVKLPPIIGKDYTVLAREWIESDLNELIGSPDKPEKACSKLAGEGITAWRVSNSQIDITALKTSLLARNFDMDDGAVSIIDVDEGAPETGHYFAHWGVLFGPFDLSVEASTVYKQLGEGKVVYD